MNTARICEWTNDITMVRWKLSYVEYDGFINVQDEEVTVWKPFLFMSTPKGEVNIIHPANIC